MSRHLNMMLGEQEAARHETGLSLELKDWKTLDKESIKEKVNAMITTIQDGWADPVDVLIFAKKGVEVFSALEKNVRPMAEAHPVGKDFVKYGTKITEGMNGVKVDYSACGDPEWNDLNQQLETVKASMKEREGFLSGITKPLDTVINGGEVLTINPPVKSGKMGFKLEIK